MGVSSTEARPESPRPPPAPDGSRDFNELYDAHVDAVWRTVSRLGVAPANVEDAVQEVFVVAHQRRADFEGRSSLKTWLVGIAVRVASAWRRDDARRARMEAVPDELVDGALSPEAVSEAARGAEVLRRVLSRLAPERREVFVLFELEELTAPEIASATGLKVNTVYSRLRLAREDFEAALRREMGAHR